jgi:hypothetical protein
VKALNSAELVHWLAGQEFGAFYGSASSNSSEQDAKQAVTSSFAIVARNQENQSRFVGGFDSYLRRI